MSVSVLNVSDVRGMVERRRAECFDVFFEAFNCEVFLAANSGGRHVDVKFSEGSKVVEIGDGFYVVDFSKTDELLDEFVDEVRNAISEKGFSVTCTVPEFRVSW